MKVIDQSAAKAVIALSALLLAGCAGVRREEPRKEAAGFRLRAPLGLDLESVAFHIPADNPLTEEKVSLGRRLFFERKLSADGTINCASCHAPERGFADPRRFSIGFRGRRGARQAPTIINRAFSRAQFWDGRAASLEEQALGPITNPIEMGNPKIEGVIARLERDPEYVAEFRRAFPESERITAQNLARAIASFERTIMSGDSPYDRFIDGDRGALSAPAQRGYRLFIGKANCASCHLSFNFTDEIYHNLGTAFAQPRPDLGRYAVTRLEGHQGAFKTPTLREIASTAPYMNDGTLRTLEEVIDYYDRGGAPNEWLSAKIKPLGLSAEEKRDLLEFLKSLSGEVTWYGKEVDIKQKPPQSQL
jgi:cytochrome c peroxidase